MLKKNLGLGARIIVGAIFVVFGTNGIAMLFFGSPFISTPPPPEGSPAAQYFAAIAGPSFTLQVVKMVQVSGALMLLSGICMPFGAIILAPVVFNIFLFHLTMDPSGVGLSLGIVLLLGEAVIGWAYWDRFKSLFCT